MWDQVILKSVEGLLEQHYHERDSAGYTDKSSLANLAEKCQQSGVVAKKCKAPGCKNGLHETGEWCTSCGGTGWTSQRTANNPNQSRTCPKCKGSMYELPKDGEALTALLHHGPWEAAVRLKGAPPCKRCNGTGAVENFNIQPKTTGVFGKPNAEAADVADKSSTVAGVIRVFAKRNPNGEHVIMLMFGGSNALRASYLGKQYGREIALWKLTRSGSLIVREELIRDANLSFDAALLRASQRVDNTIRALANLADNEAKAMKLESLHSLWELDCEMGEELTKEAYRRIDRRSA